MFLQRACIPTFQFFNISKIFSVCLFNIELMWLGELQNVCSTYAHLCIYSIAVRIITITVGPLCQLTNKSNYSTVLPPSLPGCHVTSFYCITTQPNLFTFKSLNGNTAHALLFFFQSKFLKVVISIGISRRCCNSGHVVCWVRSWK